jgi:hypothetical protein
VQGQISIRCSLLSAGVRVSVASMFFFVCVALLHHRQAARKNACPRRASAGVSRVYSQKARAAPAENGVRSSYLRNEVENERTPFFSSGWPRFLPPPVSYTS